MCWADNRFLELEVEEVGFAKLQCFSFENGFVQSTMGAMIFPKIS